MRQDLLAVLRDWVLALMIAAGLIMIGFAWRASAHDMQGHRSIMGGTNSYLYGKRIGSANPGKINCCLEGGNGDCQEIRQDELEPVDGGFAYYGHFIKQDDATLSPDGNLYVCQHKGSAPHCLFVTRPLS